MADNLDVTPGSGATAAADDIGGVLFQRVKLIHGADGMNDGDVASGNPLPVTEASASAIKTAVEALDNAVDGNYLNTNLNIAGTDVDGNSGNKSAQTQRVCVATDDVNLSAIKTSVELIDNTVGAIAGSGSPVIDSYTSAAINVDTGANSALVAAPGANKQIWVYGLVLLANVAGSFSLQDEDDTALSGIMPIAATGGFCMNPSGNFAMPWIKVATNKALEIDCVTCTADGVITYAIVSV